MFTTIFAGSYKLKISKSFWNTKGYSLFHIECSIFFQYEEERVTVELFALNLKVMILLKLHCKKMDNPKTITTIDML